MPLYQVDSTMRCPTRNHDPLRARAQATADAIPKSQGGLPSFSPASIMEAAFTAEVSGSETDLPLHARTNPTAITWNGKQSLCDCMRVAKQVDLAWGQNAEFPIGRLVCTRIDGETWTHVEFLGVDKTGSTTTPGPV